MDLSTPEQRRVLAVLTVEASRVVPLDRLVERVSSADVAHRSRATLQSYVSRLRQALVGGVSIVRRSGGYAPIFIPCHRSLSEHEALTWADKLR